MAYKFPYVNFHDFNLDWLVKKVRSAVYYVNNNPPDEYGNVNITVAGGVKTVNGFGPDAAGEVKAGTVRSVNGKSPMSLPTPGAITLTASDVGALPDSTTIPAPASNLPADLGTAYIGTSTKYARQDHVHKMPTAADVGALPSSTTIPSPALNVPENLGTAARGTSTRYARQDHVHNMPSAADVGALPDNTVIPEAATELPENIGIAAIGTSAKYAKEDHVHNMCVQTDSGTYNLNNFTDPGLFFFSGASTLSNQPSGNAAGWLLVLPAGLSLQKQLWFRSSVSGVSDTYQRLNNGGTWTSWVRFVTEEDSPDEGSYEPSAVSVGSQSSTNILSQSFSPGTYVFIGSVQFASNAVGRRNLWFINGGSYETTEVMAVDGDPTKVQISGIRKFTSTTTLTLRVWQNSGSTLSVQGALKWVRVH